MQTSPTDRDNGFDLIRLVGAALVLVHHSWRLTGAEDLVSPEIFKTDLGTIGVIMFFTSSGYLVTRSWLSDPDPARFLIRRGLRLLPLLVVTTVALAVVLGPVVSDLSLGTYFTDPGWHTYITSTMRMGDQQWGLPGAFAENPFPTAVNGSTWTIVGEVVCYIALAALGGLGLFRNRSLATAAALPSAGWLIFCGTGFGALAGPIGTFCIGVAAALHVPRRLSPTWPWAATAVGAWLATSSTWLGSPTAAVAVAVSTLTFAFACPPQWRHPIGSTDISYGLYLLSFPVQQTIAAAGVRSPWTMLVLSTVVSIPLATLSWRWLERPVLALKPRQSRRPSAEAQSTLGQGSAKTAAETMDRQRSSGFETSLFPLSQAREARSAYQGSPRATSSPPLETSQIALCDASSRGAFRVRSTAPGNLVLRSRTWRPRMSTTAPRHRQAGPMPHRD